MLTMVETMKDCRRFFPLRCFLALLWLTCGLIGPAAAQSGKFEDLLGEKFQPRSSTPAEFFATLTPSTAKPGDEVTLKIKAKLPPQSYIFAMTGDFSERTQIETKNSVGLVPVDEEFHPDRAPETKFDAVLKQELSKFHGDVTWSKKYRVAPDAEISKVSIDLRLTGQYCGEGDGGTCTRIKPPVELHAAIIEESASGKPAAKFDFSTPPISDKNPAELHVRLGPSKKTAGKTVKLVYTMKLAKDYHTFSSTFEGEGGTPTVLIVDQLYGLAEATSKPVPNKPPERITKANLPLDVYHDEVTWTQEFDVLPNTKQNYFGVVGKIKYQICNDSGCFPRTAKFSVGVTSDDLEPPKTVDEIHDSVEPFSASRPQDKGLAFFLLTAIGAAMVSLMTPCVFPMVPITVSFFLKQNEAKGGRTLPLALVFSAAIIASFVILGVGIAAIFGATKLNQLANNSYLNLFLAGVFFVFALNMLGAFEIQVPGWLLNMTATGEQAGGYVGVIFMALTFVLTSFSCTFAFVGTLLVAASQGEFYWPILGMLAFGATFASPFFVLALMPRMLKSLPKSGGWLNAVKVVMGFVELGVAVKYFSVVDQQWNAVPVLFDFTNVMTLWAALSFITGLYLLGQFRLPHDSPVQGLSPIRILLAVGFLILGGLFGIGVTQPNRDTWLINQLIAFAPARLDIEEAEIDFDKAVAYASQKNRPLFIDFTGVNCTNCRLMEKKMAKPNIHRRLDQFVQAQLYEDKVPRVEDAKEAERILVRNNDLQEKWFKTVTLPSYVIVTPDGKTILASFQGLASRDSEFIQFLDEGYEKWNQLSHLK